MIKLPVNYQVENGIIIGDIEGRRVYPTHELSGLPLLVLPIDAPQENAQLWRDFDHSFYPRTSDELRGFGGAAIRCSRGQDLPRWLHQRKHKQFPLGSIIPTISDDQHKTIVLACSDFVPRQAIDFSRGDGYEIVDLTDLQIQELARSRAVHIEDGNHSNTGSFYRNTIGKFFAYHAIKQDLSHISPGVIDEFLHTSHQLRRTELGNLLLAESVDVAIEPIRGMRQELIDQGMVQLSRKQTHTVMRKFFVKARFKDYIPELQKNLARAAS